MSSISLGPSGWVLDNEHDFIRFASECVAVLSGMITQVRISFLVVLMLPRSLCRPCVMGFVCDDLVCSIFSLNISIRGVRILGKEEEEANRY
jgi:hypothetical protein